MKHIPDIHALLRHTNKLGEFLRWLRAEGDSLIASAELLGGQKWAERARGIIAVVQNGHDLGARRRELLALHRLLNLDFTTVPGSPEAKCFAAIHPDDPQADAARRRRGTLPRPARA